MVRLTLGRAAHACADTVQRYKMLRIVRRSLAGHSKWANIRHKKGGKDAAKADQFQKLAKVIETSSKRHEADFRFVTFSRLPREASHNSP